MRSNPSLSETELDKLELFLDTLNAAEAPMNISMLHGFLTAVAIGPATVLPSQWLPEVWGKEGPVFDSEEEAEFICGLIFRLYDTISRTLAESPDEFAPLLYQEENGGGQNDFESEDWCVGFSRGVAMRAKDWDPLIEDEALGVLLTPVIVFSLPEAMAELREKNPSPQATKELLAMLPLSVQAINEYWAPRRKERAAEAYASPDARRRAKVGRNDPCPCGSGKKFKKCCGARV